METSGSGTGDIAASVIVPTYCRPRQLDGCLQALSEQELGDLRSEIIVVDDGGGVPEDLAGKWCGLLEIQLIHQANAGPGAARNRGAAVARGDLLAFTDDDCEPTRNWLAELLRAHSKGPEAVLAGATLNGLPENPYAEASERICQFLYDYYNTCKGSARFLTSNSLAIPRNVYDRIGGFDCRFATAAGEDRELASRCRSSGVPIHAVRAARVRHAHAMGLPEFLRQHFRYGRAARHCFGAERLAEKTGRGVIGTLQCRLVAAGLSVKASVWRRLRISSLIGLSQLAVACGYLREALVR